MPLRYRRHSNEWPPTSSDQATVLAWRLSRLEETVGHHQDRLLILEEGNQKPPPSTNSFPWPQTIGLGILLLLGATGRIKPELMEMASKLLLGR